MAERQRQLAALRVMDAAQLKEATRAQQGTLLAKIKERQGAIHAALVANAKEELKVLRAEAREAAGIAEEDEDEKENRSDEEDGEMREEGNAGGEKEEQVGGGRSGEGMEVEKVVEKEENAVAAAVAAARARGAGEGGEEDEKREGEESDSGMKRNGPEKGAIHAAEQGSSSSESSESDTDDSEVNVQDVYLHCKSAWWCRNFTSPAAVFVGCCDFSLSIFRSRFRRIGMPPSVAASPAHRGCCKSRLKYYSDLLCPPQTPVLCVLDSTTDTIVTLVSPVVLAGWDVPFLRHSSKFFRQIRPLPCEPWWAGRNWLLLLVLPPPREITAARARRQRQKQRKGQQWVLGRWQRCRKACASAPPRQQTRAVTRTGGDWPRALATSPATGGPHSWGSGTDRSISASSSECHCLCCWYRH